LRFHGVASEEHGTVPRKRKWVFVIDAMAAGEGWSLFLQKWRDCATL
jgi:hypothetical protein